MKKIQILTLLALASAFVNAPVSAATVIDCGTDVCFEYDDSTMYGSANIIGNSIFFLPTNFKAESLNGAGVVTANETLNIKVYSIDPNVDWIKGFAMAESGDYLLNGVDASVDVSGMLAVTSNTMLDPASAIPPFFPDGTEPYRAEEFFNAGDLNVQGALSPWSASASIDLADTAGWGSDTDVTVTLENLLSATTLNNGEQAFVEKKFGAVGFSVIPVPGAALLFPSALAALGWMRRRRKS